MPNEDFYARFAGAVDNAVLISRGAGRGQVSLKLTPDLLCVLVEGEPGGEALTACFRDMLASENANLDVPTLVDLTRFRGRVDWSALHSVRKMAAWKEGRTAYVARPDAGVVMMIKVVEALFADSRHRIFRSHDEALEWLGSA